MERVVNDVFVTVLEEVFPCNFTSNFKRKHKLYNTKNSFSLQECNIMWVKCIIALEIAFADDH